MRKWLLVLAIVPLTTFASTLFKCEVGGQVTYSDKPCQGVASKPLKVQRYSPLERADDAYYAADDVSYATGHEAEHHNEGLSSGVDDEDGGNKKHIKRRARKKTRPQTQ